MTIYFTSESSGSGPDTSEVMVAVTTTVDQCLQCILSRANIHGIGTSFFLVTY